MTQQAAATTAPTITNGVDVTALFETIKAIKNNNEIAKFQFRAKNQWIDAGHNRSEIKEFYGACEEDQTRSEPFVLDSGEPPILLGNDSGANPVEYVLHALAGCMTTTMVYHAASRGIRIEGVRSELEGDIDIRGFLGLSKDVRKGYQTVRVKMYVKSEASPEQLAELAKYSPVYDIVSKSLPVQVTIEKS
ncbi:MAG: OsmC family protein [Gammaproteobacteria bacterium]